MSWIGWTIIVALIAGMIGGLLLWARYGSRGGNDT